MYEKLYHKMFNAVTDAQDAICKMNYGLAAEILQKAQIECEQFYIEHEEPAKDDLP